MSNALRNELKRLRAQARALRDRKHTLGSVYMKQGESQEQALIREGIDPALADRIFFVRWFTRDEAEAAELLNPSYYRDRDPTTPSIPDDVEPLSFEETCRPEPPTRLHYPKDGSVV